MHGVFGEFALLLLMSAAAGAVSLWLRQPVLIAYIAMGIVAGPAVLGVVTALRIGIAGVSLYLLMRYILPRVVDRMAQSQEPAACSPCSCCCRTAPG